MYTRTMTAAVASSTELLTPSTICIIFPSRLHSYLLLCFHHPSARRFLNSSWKSKSSEKGDRKCARAVEGATTPHSLYRACGRKCKTLSKIHTDFLRSFTFKNNHKCSIWKISSNVSANASCRLMIAYSCSDRGVARGSSKAVHRAERAGLASAK